MQLMSWPAILARQPGQAPGTLSSFHFGLHCVALATQGYSHASMAFLLPAVQEAGPRQIQMEEGALLLPLCMLAQGPPGSCRHTCKCTAVLIKTVLLVSRYCADSDNKRIAMPAGENPCGNRKWSSQQRQVSGLSSIIKLRKRRQNATSGNVFRRLSIVAGMASTWAFDLEEPSSDSRHASPFGPLAWLHVLPHDGQPLLAKNTHSDPGSSAAMLPLPPASAK